jgi:hypothetical protein
MNVPKEEIYNYASGLVKDLNKLTIFEIEGKYKDFKEKFPKIYNFCLEGTDKNILRELRILLDIRESVKNDDKSDIEANVQVSEYFAKQYLYPKVGEPTLEQKKSAMSKIINGIGKN